jgi:hypothetical protein
MCRDAAIRFGAICSGAVQQNVVAAAIAFTVGKGISTLYLIPKQLSAVESWEARNVARKLQA